MRVSEMAVLLRPAEQEARAAYEALAECFAGQPDLAAFLRQLARDEAVHLELLQRAAGVDGPASIQIEEQTVQAVHGLSELVGRARAGQLTEAELLAGIARAEFSEWNEIFLYVLARFRQGEPEFQHAAAVVHQHKRHIEARLGTSAPLPPVWQERVLVVDDEEALRLLLREVLGEFGAVTLAANGAEALAQARDKFFDVIVTDVDMPAMTGPEFYRALAATGSPHCRRFIFMTGRTTPVVANLAAEAGALLLEKPFSLRALTDAVRGVLARAG